MTYPLPPPVGSTARGFLRPARNSSGYARDVRLSTWRGYTPPLPRPATLFWVHRHQRQRVLYVPAAGFVAEARQNGARTIELNLEPSEGATFFDEAVHGRATEIVPAFVESILAGR